MKFNYVVVFVAEHFARYQCSYIAWNCLLWLVVRISSQFFLINCFLGTYITESCDSSFANVTRKYFVQSHQIPHIHIAKMVKHWMESHCLCELLNLNIDFDGFFFISLLSLQAAHSSNYFTKVAHSSEIEYDYLP